jgi:RNA polymerase sigma-70 factor, ECF subfamily
MQHLPPRQRAALILRDAAGFSARETGELLGTSVPAVNSGLQRARERLRERLPSRRDEWKRSDPPAEQQEVARRYVEAIERRDFAALAVLVREDARFSFPPLPLWYDGLDAFRRGSDKHAAPGEHVFVAARANLQPAVAIYLRSPGEARYRPLALSVVGVEEGRVVEVVDWSRPELFEAFGLPMSFPPSHRSNEEEVNTKEVP